MILCVYLYCCMTFFFFVFKQKTAYEMRISDWSSDVCSSDLPDPLHEHFRHFTRRLHTIEHDAEPGFVALPPNLIGKADALRNPVERLPCGFVGVHRHRDIIGCDRRDQVAAHPSRGRLTTATVAVLGKPATQAANIGGKGLALTRP